MDKIILDIVEARKKQGLSETALAKLIGEDQNKVWRLLNGKTKKLDFEVITKLRGALGMVSELEVPYAVAYGKTAANSRRHLAYELLDEQSDEELEDLIIKLLQKKKSKSGDLPPE